MNPSPKARTPRAAMRSCAGVSTTCDSPLLLLPAPGVERVVDDHAVTQHLVVIGKIRRQALADREEAGRLRRQLGPPGIGPAHDHREAKQRLVVEAVFR